MSPTIQVRDVGALGSPPSGFNTWSEYLERHPVPKYAALGAVLGLAYGAFTQKLGKGALVGTALGTTYGFGYIFIVEQQGLTL